MEFRNFEYCADQRLNTPEARQIPKILSIRHTPDGFSFAITLPREKKAVAAGRCKNRIPDPQGQRLGTLKDIFLSHPLFSTLQYEKAVLIQRTRPFTVQPTLLTDPDQAEAYLNLAAGIRQTPSSVPTEAAIDTLFSHRLCVIYRPLKKPADFFAQKGIPQIVIRHSLTALLQAAPTAPQGEWTFCAQVDPDGFELVAQQGNMPQLLNYYPCSAAEDFLYYLLLVAKQLKADPAEVSLVLCGEIRQESKIYAGITEFFKKVSFAPPRSDLWYSRQMDDVLPHEFHTVINQAI